MRVIVSVATSADGHVDDCSPARLRLSSEEDWRQVAELRARCDAILVGAETVRRDNPSLVIRDEALRAARERPDIDKVTLTRSGDLDPAARFFTEGGGRRIVFSTRPLALPAEIILLTGENAAREIVDTLASRGYRQLMIEGGPQVLNMFFDKGLVDELRLAVAPFRVGEAGAPRFDMPCGMLPVDSWMAGDTSVSRHIAHRDETLLAEAVEESRRSTPTHGAFRVGAVVVTLAGQLFKGYTHETAPHNHAEEEAIAKALAAGARLEGATMYSSMEPCSERRSKPVSCSQLIVKHRFARAVYALAEPDTFVRNRSGEVFRQGGVEVTVIGSLAPLVREINNHLI
ncbi:MAG: dihydrofolate reductase family protein [Rikenellaceae bacterium]|jgi:5-amino-6-(5-phosphoribosylamino)uracil reductase|nr:dihydrofolate reductase family protein [Rikenellaceae bacterium]